MFLKFVVVVDMGLLFAVMEEVCRELHFICVKF